NSEHLQDAINYLTEVIKYQSENEDTFIFREEAGKYSESPVIKPLLELCSDTELYFTYPSELYLDDFSKYLSGEISLDEFIAEADRKLKVYLNE
ncbi:MAG: antitoxin VbhA family protein, partial [Oscillospiraceae bacterium]